MEKVVQISKGLDVAIMWHLGKYLGVPIHHGRVTKQSYEYMVNKMKEKISSGNARNISMAGRVTLSQAVLSAIPYYTMQTPCFPVAICKEIDKVRRDYIWNIKSERGKVHLISFLGESMFGKRQRGPWRPYGRFDE